MISATKSGVWVSAIQQIKPFKDPHRLVSVHAAFRLHNLRDPDNLEASVKSVLDALKLRPASRDKLKWKRGFFLDRGYLFDDDPAHVASISAEQTINRSNRGLTLFIRGLELQPRRRK